MSQSHTTLPASAERTISRLECEAVLNRDSAGVILAGGLGKGLFPLTQNRAVSAVPLAGKFRLIDVPVSVCISSGLSKVYVLTQFNSESTNRHISTTYSMDHFASGFVEVLAAQQTAGGAEWYQGTADAVRQNLSEFARIPAKYYFVLSGDHLYRMDLCALLAQHLASGSHLTIVTTLVERERASRFGIVQSDDDGVITRFEEKPTDDAVLKELALKSGPDAEELFEASMGIYLFDHAALHEALAAGGADFARHIIPHCIATQKVHRYRFQGFWRDLGHIEQFYQAHMDLCEVVPRFNLFDSQSPIFTTRGYLPGSKINGSDIWNSLLADGCVLSGAVMRNCVLGPRTIVEEGTTIAHSIIMGADYYPGADNCPAGRLAPGIGRNCHIERAIIDKNASIGNDVRITSKIGQPDMDSPTGDYFVRQGITVVPKDGNIPDGTVI